ncbi:MAG TPA: hypothetical protein VHH36_06325 [Candidatus Thermoplasmatota archaeon]|nr:hypothetical protein [Candidatus Thermoplasmatota archaeon]
MSAARMPGDAEREALRRLKESQAEYDAGLARLREAPEASPQATEARGMLETARRHMAEAAADLADARGRRRGVFSPRR